MSSSFSSGVDSDASGPAGGTDSIIYKKKPRHADRHSHTLARDFSKRHKLGKVSRGPADPPHLRLCEKGRARPTADCWPRHPRRAHGRGAPPSRAGSGGHCGCQALAPGVSPHVRRPLAPRPRLPTTGTAPLTPGLPPQVCPCTAPGRARYSPPTLGLPSPQRPAGQNQRRCRPRHLPARRDPPPRARQAADVAEPPTPRAGSEVDRFPKRSGLLGPQRRGRPHTIPSARLRRAGRWEL